MSEILLKQINALLVAEVEEGSPAERAGVRVGDLLRPIYCSGAKGGNVGG